MEDILKQILNQLQNVDQRLSSMDQRLTNLEQGQSEMAHRLTNLEDGQRNLEKGQTGLINEQSEMRKEVGFYYGSLMKKLDETRRELGSEINQVFNVQKQHQDVLDMMNRKPKQ